MGEKSQNTQLPETGTSSTSKPEAAEQGSKGSRLKRRFILTVVVVVSAVGAWYLGSAILPRWWAQKIGEIIGGRILFGNLFGAAMGAAFTILPLLALRAGWKFRAGWKRWLKFLVLALILAAPNLATLGIVMGTGDAAHAGERKLDVDGPGFRGGSLVGAILGFAFFVAISLLLRSRKKNKQNVAELKAKLKVSEATND